MPKGQYSDADVQQPAGQYTDADTTADAGQAAPPTFPGWAGLASDVGQFFTGYAKAAARTAYSQGAQQGPSYLSGSGLPINPDRTAPQAVQPSNPAQRYGGYAETGTEFALPVVATGVKAWQTYKGAEKAVKLFEALESQIGDHPIDVADVGNVALDAKDWSQHGGQAIKPVNDFVRRMTDPKLGDLTYSEARQFMVNTGRKLSVAEKQNMSPDAYRHLAKFGAALDAAIQNTANAAGYGDDYLAAKNLYSSSKGITEPAAAALDYAKEQVLKWAVPGTVYGFAKKYIP